MWKKGENKKNEQAVNSNGKGTYKDDGQTVLRGRYLPPVAAPPSLALHRHLHPKYQKEKEPRGPTGVEPLLHLPWTGKSPKRETGYGTEYPDVLAA